MLVTYDKPNMLTVPLVNEKHAVDKSIHFTPGVNSIDADDWARCKEFPKVKQLLAKQLLKVELKENDTEEKLAIADAPVNKAVLIVKKTLNPLLLEEWRAVESRAGVLKAIQAQLDHIEQTTAPRKAVNQ